jgi:tRNA pseudouridine55 synthase
MDGVVVIDKPAGMTSQDVVGVVRGAVRRARHAPEGGRRSGGRKVKVGHAGTLDPDATGVLVVCVGRATRLVPFLQASRKTYDARLQLGVTTTTLDASGDVVSERDASGVDEPAFCDALRAFVGDIEQVPPMVSAVKVGGERLHAKARRGEVVERDARPVTIHDIVLSDFVPGARAEASFLVTCAPGTYIRTLAADVGDRLGVGAHLVSLCRLGSGRFSLEDAVGLDTVASGGLSEALMSMSAAMADYPAIVLGRGDAVALGHGRPVSPTGRTGPVAALAEDGRLLAVVEDRDGAARPLVVVAPTDAETPESARG